MDEQGVPPNLPTTWEEWNERAPQDRMTAAAFEKYMRRAFHAGYDAAEKDAPDAYNMGYADGRRHEREGRT